MTETPVVVVCSHRGASWKSALTAGLSLELAASGLTVAIVDPAKAGGLAAADGHEWRATEGVAKCRSHGRHPLHLLHAPELLTKEAPGREATRLTASLVPHLVMLDLPMASREELGAVLRHAHLVLVTMPIDVVSFRSIPPFLEQLREQRAMPGRSFNVRCVLTGLSSESPRLRELAKTIRDHLGPILTSSDFPPDADFGADIRNGSFPTEPAAGSALATAFSALAEEVRGSLSERHLLVR